MITATETQADRGALSAALADVAARLRPSVVTVRAGGRGHGAGVIWSADGLILTNAHVAEYDRAVVVLDGGRQLDARLVARDAERDLAALRVPATGLPAAPLGDSTALRVGQVVLAIGHPLGEPHAAAFGVVHALGAAIRTGRSRASDVVQADLALYPGNSGGPLADAHGRVVGINSMAIPPRLALAVPTAVAARFVEPGRHARIGVRTRRVALPPPLAHQLDWPGEHGLMVVEILPDEPAATAGLLPGDVLLAADTLLLGDPTALADYLDARAGAAVVLRILRGGLSHDVRIVPRSAP